jgi:hypothetical protein
MPATNPIKCLALLLGVVMAASASAATIPLANPSLTYSPTGWMGPNDAGSFSGWNRSTPAGGAPLGHGDSTCLWNCWGYGWGGLSQDSTYTIAAAGETLTAGIWVKTDANLGAGTAWFNVSLKLNGSVVALAQPAFASSQDWTNIIASYVTTAADVGKTVGIAFSMNGGPGGGNPGYSYMDDATLTTVISGAPTVAFNHFPKPLQLYPRNLATGLGNVLVDGVVTSTNCTQVALSILRNGVLYSNLTQSLTYSDGTAPFSINAPIPAELASYDFQFFATRNGTNHLIAAANDVVAGDVFVINGQSNAEARQFHDSANGNTNRYLRSFGTRDDSGATVAADLNWHLADGDPVYGPGAVGQWGLRLGRLIIDTYGIPVAIINGARGGWPITSFQRNDAKREDLQTDYGRTLFRAREAGVQNSVRALLWYQGESENGDADAHEKGWITLHSNWREDFPAIEKFYVFQLHVGCGVDQFNTDLRNRQRLLADRFADVEVMSTTGVSGDGCHYTYVGGYATHAANIFRLMQRDLYGAAPQNNIEPPNPYYAYFSAVTHNLITVIMRNASDSLSFTPGAEADFRLEGSAVTVLSGVAVSNQLVLTLSGDASGATGISYGSHTGAAAPAITNANGVGLLAFHNLPIQPSLGAPGVPANVASLAVCNDRIDLTWAAATNAAEYLIRRNGVVIGKTTGTVFTDSTVTAGPLYNYDIAAVSPVSTSAWSSVTSVMTVPDNVFAFVPEATNFTVLYRLDIPNDLRLGPTLKAPYAVDDSDGVTQPFDRVAYYVELQTDPGQPLKWVYVSCNPFTTDPKRLGVPSLATGGIFHQPISNLNVYASAGAAVATGQGLGAGNLEFWGWNYQTANGYGIPGASGTTYDSGDMIDTGGTYGSMQIFRAGQTLFGYNSWGLYTADSGSQSSDDLGIGTQPTGHPDWTFAANCFRYSYKRLYVLVCPAKPARLTATTDGNPSHLTLSWPADHVGWTLMQQTGRLNLGVSAYANDWMRVSGSAATTSLTVSILSNLPGGFYRLVYP